MATATKFNQMKNASEGEEKRGEGGTHACERKGQKLDTSMPVEGILYSVRDRRRE